VLSGVLVLRSNQPAPVAVAVLQAQDGKPAWLLRVEAGGTLRVESLAPAQLDAASDYELWILPKGATAVRSLGVVPARPGSVVTVRALDAEPGAELLITREPAGGAPEGKPTSTPIFRAALQRV
jgi:anti-sigma-K factor RskA